MKHISAVVPVPKVTGLDVVAPAAEHGVHFLHPDVARGGELDDHADVLLGPRSDVLYDDLCLDANAVERRAARALHESALLRITRDHENAGCASVARADAEI